MMVGELSPFMIFCPQVSGKSINVISPDRSNMTWTVFHASQGFLQIPTAGRNAKHWTMTFASCRDGLLWVKSCRILEPSPVFHASQGRFSSWTSPQIALHSQMKADMRIYCQELGPKHPHLLFISALILAQALLLITVPYYIRWTQPWGPGLYSVCLLLRCCIWHGPTVKPPTCFSSPASLAHWKGGEIGMERLMQSAWVRLNFRLSCQSWMRRWSHWQLANWKATWTVESYLEFSVWESVLRFLSYLQDL